MPRLSAFYGIVIGMFYRDHPPPHFHARYADSEAKFDISTLEVIDVACRHALLDSSENGPSCIALSWLPTGNLPSGVFR
jgi:hypothetical protein